MKMRGKWSHNNSLGTILNDPIVSPPKEGSQMSQLMTFHNANDHDDGETCETSRLAAGQCDELSDYDDEHLSDGQLCNWRLYKGICYSSMSSVFFSLCSVIVKYLDTIHPGELAVFRFIGILVLTIPLVVSHGGNPFGPSELRHFLILRGIAGATSLFLRFCAFRYLPIADASVIIFSVPVFVSIFARIFLKEPCGIFQSIIIFMTMIGLALTTKFPIIFGSDGDININSTFINSSTAHVLLNQTIMNNYLHNSTVMISPRDLASTQRLHHIYGVLSALGSTGFAASVFIFIRKAKGAHHSVIMFNFGWVAIIETTAITAILNEFSMPNSLFQWTLIIILGVFSFCGQMLLTRSLQLEQAGPVSVVRAATDIALAFVWQLWLFHDIPDGWSITGALMVTTCILMTSLRKWLLALPEHSRIRSRLFFLTL